MKDADHPFGKIPNSPKQLYISLAGSPGRIKPNKKARGLWREFQFAGYPLSGIKTEQDMIDAHAALIAATILDITTHTP